MGHFIGGIEPLWLVMSEVFELGNVIVVGHVGDTRGGRRFIVTEIAHVDD
jgi:hypothetical protein